MSDTVQSIGKVVPLIELDQIPSGTSSVGRKTKEINKLKLRCFSQC